ncbi:MAG: PDZ domain-containing protein [Rikenellaceae bacterium]|nr:PDZ domain-containing protein [Rikenellaceae bacterium]
MRRENTKFFARALREVATKVLMVAMVISMAAVAGCSEDPTNGGDYTNGVQLPEESSKKCGPNQSLIKFNIKTSAGYKLEVDNSDMLIVRMNSAADKGGSFSVEVEVTQNKTGAERKGNVFITVNGYSRTKVMEITQTAGATDEVVKWVDQRLQDEYYWLDEYKEKLNTFDYTLAYDKFLSTSLLSMTTNMEDGYVVEGTRYLYSYITQESATRADDDRMENSFGILIAGRYFGGSNNTAILVVEHVYPGSPAANAGLKRGDTISKVDNATIPSPTSNLQQFYTLRSKLESGTGSITIEGETYDKQTQKDIVYRKSLTAADYLPSPVAHYTVLEFDEAVAKVINPDGKKIGYLSYLGFESEYDAELIEAMEYLAAKGITDLILDLRVNGGGSVNTSTMLGSMLLSEEYEGKTYATLKRNPKNKLVPAEYLNEDCLITKNGLGDEFKNKDLPNLDLPELWVIASNSTASASEMVIKGLEGLDVPVHIVGKTTNGKNCGMDVMEKTFGSYIYTYAPITFMNFNAKGDNDYADGIKPQVNFDDYYNESNIQSSYQTYQCYVFPMPMNEWAEMNFTPSENGGISISGDFALCETVLRIGGRTMLKSGTSAALQFKPTEMMTTRAAEAKMVYDANIIPQNRAYGATLTEAEREALRANRE